MPSPAYRLGFWSAVLATLFIVGFLVTLLLGGIGAGVLKAPWDPVLPFGFSLLLALAFLVLMSCVHRIASEEKKIWSQVGLSFSLLYVAMVSIVYFVNITVVTPLTQAGQVDKVTLLVFQPGGSFMDAVDGLGYTFMSLATLFAAPVFVGSRLANLTRRAFILHGFIAIPTVLAYSPLLIPQPYYSISVSFDALWAVTAPLATILASVYFRRNWSTGAG